MRQYDKELADGVSEPTFVFLSAQTEEQRTEITELGQYLQYRERDVGKALLSTLMRFVTDLHLTKTESQEVRLVEQNCGEHISIMNDIQSWEKELRQSQVSPGGGEEGSHLCSGVKVLADSVSIDIVAVKARLWTMVWNLK
ncbi:Aristolochene synthase [Cytospora mali]|uniref:Aristolochene synthase n=1 Tax=Cytospora mali TaxID=578113 RepID=A0A194VD12_CYTMA|nr:Aristolochene synthase [Valsa mali var. pyri (nom. inval.)]